MGATPCPGQRGQGRWSSEEVLEARVMLGILIKIKCWYLIYHYLHHKTYHFAAVALEGLAWKTFEGSRLLLGSPKGKADG